MKTRIPSLDGLRAPALFCVLLSHELLHVPDLKWRWWLSANAHLSVALFFCLSGYLITSLLDDEMEANVRLDLRRFYVRRFFRIVPPYFTYVGAVAVSGLAGWRPVVTAATFTQGYSPWGTNELFGHTWSLSIEEQFYLLWPAALFLLGRQRATRLALTLVLISPAIRVANHLLPVPGYWDFYVLHTRMDGLMIGCCAALLRHDPTFQRICRLLLKPTGAALATLFAIVISPALTHTLGGAYLLPIGMSLEGLALLWMILYVVHYPSGWAGRFLNWKPVAHIGMISYSVYLWQQLLLVGPGREWFGFPLNWLMTFALAELSWRTVEAWSRRVRRNLEKRPAQTLAATA